MKNLIKASISFVLVVLLAPSVRFLFPTYFSNLNINNNHDLVFCLIFSLLSLIPLYFSIQSVKKDTYKLIAGTLVFLSGLMTLFFLFLAYVINQF